MEGQRAWTWTDVSPELDDITSETDLETCTDRNIFLEFGRTWHQSQWLANLLDSKYPNMERLVLCCNYITGGQEPFDLSLLPTRLKSIEIKTVQSPIKIGDMSNHVDLELLGIYGQLVLSPCLPNSLKQIIIQDLSQLQHLQQHLQQQHCQLLDLGFMDTHGKRVLNHRRYDVAIYTR